MIKGAKEESATGSQSVADGTRASTVFSYPDHASRFTIPFRKSKLIPSWMGHACVEGLLSHVLYSRGFLGDYTLEELLSSSKEESNGANGPQMQNTTKASLVKTSIKDRRKDRKLLILKTRISELVHHVDRLFQCAGPGACSSIHCIVVTLGSSILNPKEQYVIEYLCSCHLCQQIDGKEDVTCTRSREGIKREIKRRVIRELIQVQADSDFRHFSANSIIPKVTVSAFVKRSVLVSLNASKHESSLHAGNIIVRSPFTIKDPKPLSRRKNIFRPFVVISVVGGEMQSEDDDNCERFGCQCGDFVWISLPPVKYVKGIN